MILPSTIREWIDDAFNGKPTKEVPLSDRVSLCFHTKLENGNLRGALVLKIQGQDKVHYLKDSRMTFSCKRVEDLSKNELNHICLRTRLLSNAGPYYSVI